MNILVQLLIGVALTVVAYLLMPRAKQVRPEVKDAENPVADAGKPMPVVFGRVRITSLNIIWYGDKSKDVYETSA